MSAFLPIVCELNGSTSSGDPSTTWISCRPVGAFSRTVGLTDGDPISVVVDRSKIPGSWDMTKPFRVRFGTYDESGPTYDVVTLGAYHLRFREPLEYGRNFPREETPGDVVPHAELLSFTTVVGLMRDGRGGLLTRKTFNPLNDSGNVDTDHEDYEDLRTLAVFALHDLGFPFEAVPAEINLAVDGSTLTAPGPIDWGNAHAIAELEALLARIGWAATLTNDGTKITLHPLLRAGQTLVIPSSITEVAEPYLLTQAPGVRGSKIVVTSGRTRTTVVTGRLLDGSGAAGFDPLEWVAYDTRDGVWKNQAQWEADYPGEIGPDDIDEFNDGPAGTDANPERVKQFGRLYSALRLTGDDLKRASNFVAVGAGVELEEGVKIGGTSAVAYSLVAVELGDGQLRNYPEDGSGDPVPYVRIDDVAAIPGEGVFVLGPGAFYVRLNPGPTGGYADAEAFSADEINIVFAHESNTGVYLTDYFVTAWEADATGGNLSVTQLTGEDLTDAIADPLVPKVDAPFLRRVLIWGPDDEDPAFVNEDELEAIAEQIALMRLAGAEVQSGTIEMYGLVEIEPGDADGAITRVTWDIARNRTIVLINEHEVPGSFYDQLEEQAARSIAAGWSRVYRPGSSIALTDVKAGSTPDDAASNSNADPESKAASRGRERSKGGVPAIKSNEPLAAPLRQSSTAWIQITGATAIEGESNRWEYDWAEVAWSASGWAAITGGRSSSTHGEAYNTVEVPNDSAGVQGNGVDIDELPGTFEIKPIATGVVVLAHGPFVDDTTKAWWFSLVNAVDGSCEE